MQDTCDTTIPIESKEKRTNRMKNKKRDLKQLILCLVFVYALCLINNQIYLQIQVEDPLPRLISDDS